MSSSTATMNLPTIACSVNVAVERAPDFRARRAGRELQDHELAQVGQRLVQRDPPDALDAELVAQMGEEQRLVGEALDHARFARRHLADDRGDDGVAAARDRGHLDDEVVFLERDMAVRFAERAFRLEVFRIDEALDHELRLGRHQEVDRARRARR